MQIIAISGRKQSGKTTIGNFILSLFLSNMGVSKEIKIDDTGDLLLSDLYGNTTYNRITPRHKFKNDFVICKLYDELDKYIKIYNFADTLKQNLCMNIFGMSYEQCYGSDEDKNSMTDLYWEGKQLSAREAMQIIGTDLCRKLKNNVWIDATMSLILQESPKLAIITDCRFPDEVTAVKNSGGRVIRLTRNIHHSEHISETSLDKENYDWNNFSYILDNQSLSIYEQSLRIQEWLQTVPLN